MTPKKKTGNRSTSETTSAASTSGSSSTASSSSGSNSSSSTDTDSSCRPNKTATDSKKHRTKHATKTKSQTPKLNYSSGEEEGVRPKASVVIIQTGRRKSNAKPKTSATITPHKRSQPKTVTKKRGKTNAKSIFSPENSSESDNKLVKHKNPNHKPRTKASPSVKRSNLRSSSGSASGSSSTGSSVSDSDLHTSKSKLITKDSRSDSEDEVVGKLPKKLTRSSNTRKSVHVLGKNAYSDSDTDSESTKRSLSHSPVKKAQPVKNTKARASEIVIHEERKCPIEVCDSNGHLGGRQDKHFTIEACLLYHNVTNAQSKVNFIERKKREDLHKKALEHHRKIPRSHTTSEQKQHMLKIKEARAKFKQDVVTETSKIIVDKDKQPSLNNIVPDYDLKLFRDAEAIASEKIEEELKSLPNCKGTKCIEMGKFEMEVWYQSPYPEEFARAPKLYICEFCLRYMKSRTVLLRHVVKCVWRHPPGEEVYRKDKISVWEVDGKRYKQYCQNLCLLAKFFLDHKTLYYDVEPFLFYVMTLADRDGCHTVGYFSKEKNSFLNYNVSCILTLPPYQRQGYGRLLIDFSYLLTRVEGKIGSPEKPLSDLGLISYRSYWKDVLLGYLCSTAGTTLSVKDISQEMSIHSYDIVSTLQALGMMKYWKGKHIILKKQDVLDEYVERVKRRGSLLKEVDPECLRWKPFVLPQPIPNV